MNDAEAIDEVTIHEDIVWSS